MRSVLLIALFFISIRISAQNADTPAKIFQVVDQMPEFPGGEKAMMTFIQQNIQYPDFERAHDIQGRIVVGFVINVDGSVSDVSVKKSVSKGIDDEAVRVVKLFPKFKPGRQQGKDVKVAFVLPISFKLSGDDKPVPAQVYQVVEHMPEYPGGDKAVAALIQKNIVYPDSARANKIEGRVVVGFTVNEDGSLSDFCIKRGGIGGNYDDLDAEAMRVARLLHNFKPGSQGGKKVKVAMIQPIEFSLSSIKRNKHDQE